MLPPLVLFNWMREHLLSGDKPASEAASEAKWIFLHILQLTKDRLYTNTYFSIRPAHLLKLRQLLSLRNRYHFPLHYLLGSASFRDLSLIVSPAVLIPRPETEQLVDLALEQVKQAPPLVTTLVDVGTGSGAIAISLKKALPEAQVYGLELQPEALAVARRNGANQLPANKQPQWLESHLLSALPVALAGTVDGIIANLPYIGASFKASLAPEVRQHEPATALFAEEEGQALIQNLVVQAKHYLKPGGWLWLELSPEQAHPIAAYALDNGYTQAMPLKDWQGNWRFVKAQWVKS
jgi:release factor glutamine methyltransferase